jgi:hypothetical protein
VSDYRCFLLNDRGMILKAEVISARADAEAIAAAMALFQSQGLRHGGFELWQRDRLVHKHKASPGS